MKKKSLLLPMLVCGALALASCGAKNGANSNATPTTDVAHDSTITFDNTANDVEESKVEIDSTFTITSTDGQFVESNGVVTILTGGTYVLSGALKGRIAVEADGEDVELDLNGVKIECDTESPITCLTADSLKIKALTDTYNEIIDSRSEDLTDTTGKGAIYTKCDTKLAGDGLLYIEASYNNGIHTTKDLSIKNINVKVKSKNHALKGNDSVTIESGELVLISLSGDGIKTEDTDISSKGNQRGTITLSGGIVDIYCYGDALDAAYNAVVSDDVVLNARTYSYSSYSIIASTKTSTKNAGFGGGPGGFGGWNEGNTNKSPDSSKGIKAGNEVIISGGTIKIEAYDDGIHANMESELENGESALGRVSISGGTITITASDDGIHADHLLAISGGVISILSSYEGLEGNVIKISDGSTYVKASDDGVNAAGQVETPLIDISGGLLDVTVPTGDTDGIDSNGSYKQTGGFVISRCGATGMGGNAAALDTDGECTITGGTFINVGSVGETPSSSSQNWVLFGSSESSGGFSPFGGGPGGPGGGTSSTTSLSAGTYTVSGTSISFTLSTSYTGLWISSDELVKGNSYTMGSYSWKQDSGKTTV